MFLARPVFRAHAVRLLTVIATLSASAAALAQSTPALREEWNVQVSPFHIIGNVHYVGAKGVSAFLITTSAGSILIDGGLPETAPLIARNVAALGFDLRQVKHLLNSHAHFDHAGGLAELKRLSGAKLVASRADAPTLRAGAPSQPAVTVEREIDDGGKLELGGTTLTARVTPGHTKGCTTWTMSTREGDRTYDVVFYCSTSVVDRLVGNTSYPGIVADYEQSFKRLRALPCDVFLAPHAEFFDMASKLERRKSGAPNPFIDATELRRHVDASEQKFRATLATESATPAK
jgi:metallo-beta-lactamase class B